MTQAIFYGISQFSMSDPSQNSVILLTFLIFLCSLAFYTFRISQPQELIWDEVYQVPAAQTYLTRSDKYYGNMENPPLGKQFIALSIRLLGNRTLAYRIPSALAAAGIAALLFLAAFWISHRIGFGLFASALWLTSTMGFVHARLGTLDMMLTFAMFAGITAFLGALLNPKNPRRFYWLILACFFAAMAGAVKVLGLILFPVFFLGLLAIRNSWPLSHSLPRFLISGIVLTVLVFYGSYRFLGFSAPEIWEGLNYMYHFHQTDTAFHTHLSRWYEWFFLQGSLWYHRSIPEEGLWLGILLTPNPVLWISGEISIAVIFCWGILKRNPVGIVLGSTIALQVLFWILFKQRTLLYYSLPWVPFFCLAVTLFFFNLSKIFSKLERFIGIWMVLVLLGSGFGFWKYYSLISGQPMDKNDIKKFQTGSISPKKDPFELKIIP